MIRSLILFLAAFVVVALLTPLVIAVARRYKLGIDEPDSVRKNHALAVPRLGGVPVMLVVSLTALAIALWRPGELALWVPVFAGAGLFFLLGLIDDLRGLDAKRKFVAQIAVALLVYGLGVGIDRVSYPGGAWSVELSGWSLLVTVFWLVAIPNIVNLIDGFDGLAGGLGMFMAGTLGLVGLMAEQQLVAWFSFALAGALLGFLVFNFPPAKIFLGDGGAYLIGFCIAAVSTQSSQKGSVAAVLFVTIVALGLPILDTSFAMIRRTFRGFPLFHADDEHIHHRLEALGFSKQRIIIGVYGVCVVLSLVGLSIFWSQGRTIPIAIGVVFLLALIAVRYLRYFTGWADLQRVMNMKEGRRRDVRYALLQARLLELEIERCNSREEFLELLHNALARTGFRLHDGGGGEYADVTLSDGDGHDLPLLAPIDSVMPDHWRRLAKCFVPVLRKANEKWRLERIGN